jgi:hypothetical protein
MRGRRGIIMLAVVAGGLLAPNAAGADCLSAEASYRVLGGTRQHVVGPKRCVANTPFPERAYLPLTVEPAGTGVTVGVWVPLP